MSCDEVSQLQEVIIHRNTIGLQVVHNITDQITEQSYQNRN